MTAETNSKRAARLEHLLANHHLKLFAETYMSSLAFGMGTIFLVYV